MHISVKPSFPMNNIRPTFLVSLVSCGHEASSNVIDCGPSPISQGLVLRVSTPFMSGVPVGFVSCPQRRGCHNGAGRCPLGLILGQDGAPMSHTRGSHLLGCCAPLCIVQKHSLRRLSHCGCPLGLEPWGRTSCLDAWSTDDWAGPLPAALLPRP